MSESADTLGARVRALRARAGISQQKLARLARLSVSAVASLEQGRTARPQPDTLKRIAAALVVTAAELDGEGAP